MKKGTQTIMYKNRITLIGFLGADAEAKTTTNDHRLTILSLATQESWKDKESGEWVRRTEWHRIVCWGMLGEFAATLRKGAHIEVEGTLRSREYTPKGEETTSKRGKKAAAESKPVRVWEVRAESILKLDRAIQSDAAESASTDEVPF